MRPYAILYRLFVFNAVVAAWLAYTDIDSQWFRTMVIADTSRLSILIMILFAVIMLSLFNNAWRTARATNAHNGNTVKNHEPVGKWRLYEIEHIGKAASWMFMIGLIGTIIGLSISLAKVDLQAFDNVQGLKAVAIQMIAGLRIELGVTVIGAIFGLWTEINYIILKYTVSLLAHQEHHEYRMEG